jgi:hypothetical protein
VSDMVRLRVPPRGAERRSFSKCPALGNCQQPVGQPTAESVDRRQPSLIRELPQQRQPGMRHDPVPTAVTPRPFDQPVTRTSNVFLDLRSVWPSASRS